MGMTIYLFDKWKRVRRILPPNSVTDLVHQESTGSLTGIVHADVEIANGNFIGFQCYDRHFRLFEITEANLNDELHYYDVTATDAVIAELKGKVIDEELQQLHVKLDTAIKGILPGSEWEVTGPVPDRLENSRAYFTNAWTMLQTFMQLYEWSISCYYRFENGSISHKVIELQDSNPVFRGRIFRSRLDASKVYVSKTGTPINRLYGLGPAQGSRDVHTNMTFANVVWSKANGDPVDKPKGQSWVGDPDASPDDPVKFDIASFDDAADENDLLKKTLDELLRRKNPTVKAEATISDIESVPGYSREKARIGDLVALVLDTGGSIEAKIIDVKRNYIRKGDTKIFIGDKRETIKGQVESLISSVTHTIERLTIHKNRFEENEKIIDLHAETIHLHGEQIKLMATQTAVDDVSSRVNKVEIDLDAVEAAILLLATKEEVSANKELINSVQIELDAAEAAINLKADQSVTDGLSTRLSTAEADINAAEAAITLKADQSVTDGLSSRVSSAEADIAAAEAAIRLKADQSVTDALTTRVSTAEANIDAANAAIKLKADQSTTDGLTSRISSAEADIDAAEAAILLKAEQSIVDSLGTQLNTVQVDLDAAEAAILLKASQSDLDDVSLLIDGMNGTITAHANEISLKANKTYVDNLVASYATIEDLRALEAYINSLDALAGDFVSVNTNFLTSGEVSTSFLSASSFTHAGSTVSQRSISMGSVSSAGAVLSTGELNLAHSHQITEENGVVTLGEVSSTGGSFNIATTKFYKDGVAAAIESVTMTYIGWQGGNGIVEASNGKTQRVPLPGITIGGGDVFVGKKTTVTANAETVPAAVATKEIDATPVYDAGVASVTANSPTVDHVEHPGGTSHLMRVYMQGKASNGAVSSVVSELISAQPVYDVGYNDGYAAGYQAAKDATKVVGGITSIVNTAQNYYQANGWASAQVDGEQVDYTTFSKAQSFG